MSDFKIKISDIFRYILLGCIEAMLCAIIILPTINSNELSSTQISSWWEELNKLSFDPTILTLVLALSAFYILGYITQLIIQLFFRGNYLGTGICEVACFIKDYPDWFTNSDKYPYPDWIYYSNAPDRAVEMFLEILDSEPDGDGKQRFSIANQLFQGLSFALLIFTVFVLHYPILDKIFISLALILIFSIIGKYSTRNPGLVVISRALAYLVPLAAGLLICNGDEIKDFNNTVLGITVGAAMCISNIVATRLARRQIRRLDLVANSVGDDDDDEANRSIFSKTLRKIGLPKVYVLTRVDMTTAEYLREQITSVSNQIYPNIKQILLIDSQNMSEFQMDRIKEMIRHFQDEHGMQIQYSRSIGTGAAALSYEIRQLFVNSAKNQDISICLDSDDRFADNKVVSRIVAKMTMTQSNVCIIGFEIFGDIGLNFAKNYHNDLVKKISKNVNLWMKLKVGKRRSVLPERMYSLSAAELIDANEAHHVSTLGWTKCYTKTIAAIYQEQLQKQSRDKNHGLDFVKNTKYEDFPDITALLLTKSKICAVSDTSILFRKRGGSATTNMTKSNYENITYFLLLTRQIAEKINKDNQPDKKQENTPDPKDKKDLTDKPKEASSNSRHSIMHVIKRTAYNNPRLFRMLRKRRLSKDEINELLKEITRRRQNHNLRNKPKLTDGAVDLILDRFIPYKFVQYLNGLYKKTYGSEDSEISNYSCDAFYTNFQDAVYPNEEQRLQDGIKEILKDNLVYGIFDDVPKGVMDHCRKYESGELSDLDFHEIAEGYKIKPSSQPKG